MAKHRIGATGQIAVPKNATAVVNVVSNIAPAASGSAVTAMVSTGALV